MTPHFRPLVGLLIGLVVGWFVKKVPEVTLPCSLLNFVVIYHNDQPLPLLKFKNYIQLILECIFCRHPIYKKGL